MRLLQVDGPQRQEMLVDPVFGGAVTVGENATAPSPRGGGAHTELIRKDQLKPFSSIGC